MSRGIPKEGFRRPKGVYKAEQERKKLDRATKIASVQQVKDIADKAVYSHLTAAPATPESDLAIREKLASRFKVLDQMTESICKGTSRALICSGPPGLGKSTEIVNTLQDKVDGGNYVIAKGFIRPTGLYKTLYTFRKPGQITMLDDCDSAFGDITSLNILKAAIDTTKLRTITWGCDTKMEDANGDRLPFSFDYEGSLILITNFDFEYSIRSNHRHAEHFSALLSRAHYVDMEMKTLRDYIVRIHVVCEEGMLRNLGVEKKVEKDLLKFMEDNAAEFRELSLRTPLKLVDLHRMDRKDWKSMAKVTMFSKYNAA